jgi:D-proline reductase (dithiol) PrdB
MESISPTQLEFFAKRIAEWAASLPGSHERGHFLPNDELHWTPLAKPLSECVLAVVSSAGIHTQEQPPFDLLDPLGDPTIREIPGDVDTTTLHASHAHVDTGPANEDMNCVFPLDRLREFADAGRIGGLAPTHFGIMGFCPPVEKMRDDVGPAIAARMHDERVDAALLVAG